VNPNFVCRLGRRKSPSTSSVFLPRSALAMARWAAIVVFPSPGAALVITIERNRPSKSDSRMVLRIVRTASSKSDVER
jgi:hypothetical protein